jgi:hypothetical protein
MFKPVLLNAFRSNHDQDNALNQWPCLAAIETDAACDSCPACSIPTLDLGGNNFSNLHVDVCTENSYGADTTHGAPPPPDTGKKRVAISPVFEHPLPAAVCPVLPPSSEKKRKPRKRKPRK